MKIRPLLIDEDAKREIKRVVDWATAHPLMLRDTLKIKQGKRKPPGDSPEFTTVIKLGYRCVFTIDEGIGGKHYRHLSVSVLGDGDAPGVAAVEVLLKEFGMTCDLGVMSKGCKPDHFELEDIGGGKTAVSVWQKKS